MDISKKKTCQKSPHAISRGCSPFSLNNLAFYLCIKYHDEDCTDIFDLLYKEAPITVGVFDELMEYASILQNKIMMRHIIQIEPNVNITSQTEVTDLFNKTEFQNWLMRRTRKYTSYLVVLSDSRIYKMEHSGRNSRKRSRFL